MNNISIKEQKRTLRQLMRKQKSLVSTQQKQAEADTVFATIEQSQLFEHATNILLYYSHPDELPTHNVIKRWQRLKQLFLPRVNGNDLDIVAYSGELDDNNAFHIGEPVGPALHLIPDLIIVPAVALDKRCMRCGRGRGYYDRLLSQANTTTIGVSLNCQIVDVVPCEAHDKPLDAIATASLGLIINNYKI